jgi:hypothetical protein
VTDLLVREQEQDRGGVIYTCGSRQQRESWHKDPEPRPYFGASVPFDGRLIEVTVNVFLEHEAAEADRG